MSDGIGDEQRMHAWRDHYGKVLYEAMVNDLSTHSGVFSVREAPTWESEGPEARGYFGRIAEAVIDVYVTGTSPAPAPAGTGEEGQGGNETC